MEQLHLGVVPGQHGCRLVELAADRPLHRAITCVVASLAAYALARLKVRGFSAFMSTTFFTFQQGFTQNFTLISAAGFIMIAPMLILFLLLQRRFINGLANSGMGGI